MRVLLASLGVLAGALLAPAGAAALSLEPIDGTDYAQPTYVTSEPGDPDRLYVVEQDGLIQRSEGGATTQFLDIESLVRSPSSGGGNEEGLLSIAFAPDYPTSGLLYVYYTDTGSDLRIAELDADAPGQIEDTLRPVLTIDHPGASNHNGGQLQFGPDGYLYAATGDGGGGGDPGDNAQDTSSMLGKLLRIDPAGAGAGDYSVPADNPFAGDGTCDDGVCDEIWSYGLRNPWRFSFDRQTAALAIGDVGQNTWEEVDYATAPNAGRGVNFGWDCHEGMHPYTGPPDGPSPLCPGAAGTFTAPVFEYGQVNGNCSITGGYVARDPALGDLLGRYLYVDLCIGDVRSMCPVAPAATDRSEGLDVQTPTSFGEDADGRVYIVERGGTVSRLTGAAEPGECPQTPPSSPTGDPPSGPADDATPPDLELRGKSRWRPGSRLKLVVSADEAAEVALGAAAKRAARGRVELRDKALALDAGETERVRWTLGSRERRRVSRALRRGRKAAVEITGVATDPSGNLSEPESLKIRLVR